MKWILLMILFLEASSYSSHQYMSASYNKILFKSEGVLKK